MKKVQILAEGCLQRYNSALTGGLHARRETAVSLGGETWTKWYRGRKSPGSLYSSSQ